MTATKTSRPNGHRLTQLTAVLSALALIVVACAGPAGSPTGVPDSTEPAASASAPASAAPPTGRLVVWNYFSTPGQIEALDGMKALFAEEYPGVEVVYETQPFEQLTSSLLAAAATQQGPDVIVYQWGDVLRLVEAGALASMEPFFSTWAEAQIFPDAVVHRVQDGKYDPQGDVHTIQPYVNLIGLYYNKAILDEVGIQPPSTFAEFETALDAVTQAGHKGLVIDWRPGVGGWWGGMPWIWAHGADATMAPEQRDTIEQVLTMVRSWVEAGYVPADVVTFDQQAAMVQWLAGDFAFTVNGNWELTRAIDEAPFEWDVVPIPAGPAGSSVYLGGEGVALGAFSENPQLAWDYLATTWLSRDGQLSLVDTVGSIPVRTDLADAPEIRDGKGIGAFAQEVASGQRLPITQAENEAQTLFGDTWSAVVAGQLSPSEAADRLVTEVPRILATE